jgi:hypothetical protein
VSGSSSARIGSTARSRLMTVSIPAGAARSAGRPPGRPTARPLMASGARIRLATAPVRFTTGQAVSRIRRNQDLHRNGP